MSNAPRACYDRLPFGQKRVRVTRNSSCASFAEWSPPVNQFIERAMRRSAIVVRRSRQSCKPDVRVKRSNGQLPPLDRLPHVRDTGAVTRERTARSGHSSRLPVLHCGFSEPVIHACRSISSDQRSATQDETVIRTKSAMPQSKRIRAQHRVTDLLPSTHSPSWQSHDGQSGSAAPSRQ